MADFTNGNYTTDNETTGQSGEFNSQETGQKAAEKNDVFKFRDPQKGQEVELPKTINGVNVQELIGHTIAKSRKDAQREFNQKFEQLKGTLQEKETTLEQMQQKFQEIEESQLSEQERFKKQYEREIGKYKSELEKYQGEAQKNFEIFKNEKIRNDIMSSFGGYQLNNPSQAYQLMKAEMQAELVQDDNGNFITRLNFDDEQLTPGDAVKKWLARPENFHHLKNNLRPGSGTSLAGGKDADGSIVYKRSQLTDPTIRKEYMDNMKKGQPVKLLD